MTAQHVVVVVEDDALTRDALANLLELEGYSVVACASGKALMARVAREPSPAVVVLDLSLPDMSGGECLHALRRSSWAHVPVLIFSGWGHLERFGLDADALLSKGCDPTSIARAVDRLVCVREAIPLPRFVSRHQ